MINTKLFTKNPYYLLEIMSLLTGALLPLSFAPYELFWLQFPLIAFLFISCIEQTPAVAFRRAMLFGLGWFIHGIHWIFYSLHYHGGTPIFLAVIIVILLAAYLSLFPGLALYLANRFFKSSQFLMFIVVYPVSWMVFDWLRGYFLTGFPWLQIGVAQVDTYLSGYGPLIGGLGVGLIVTIIAGLLAMLLLRINIKQSLSALVLIYLAGFLLTLIEWTEPVGEPVKVSLIQGNIPQSEKWKPENYRSTLQMYRDLTRQNWQSDLIIWPETAIPGFRARVPAYLDSLAKEASNTQTEVMLGIFIRDKQSRRYYNSIITLDGQVYLKRHLVPLGEFFPLRPVLGFFTQWIDIPMSDIDSGKKNQPLIKAAGQTIGLSICFEDAFDRDVLLDLPQATLLVNVSNDAWFEDSPQPWQHHQIARMRALETGRTMLRVTNTGVSSVISPKGAVLAITSQFQRELITRDVQAYQGATPYVIWANYLLIISGLTGLLIMFKKYRH